MVKEFTDGQMVMFLRGIILVEREKEREGEEIMSNGNKYEGNYKNGQFHGYGVYQLANGDVFKGNFIRGIR